MKFKYFNTFFNITYILLVLLTLISCYNASQSNLYSETQENTILRDTTLSDTLKDKIRSQIRDYLDISRKVEFKKFVKYTPKFVYKCTIIDGINMSEKYDMNTMLHMIFLNTIEQKNELNKKLALNNYSIKYTIDSNIRGYCNDTTMFANVDLIGYLYKGNEKRDSTISNFVCISENGGKNWKFLDKDGSKEILECHFSPDVASYIMMK